MDQQSGQLEGVRGLSIYYQCWLPEGKPRALVLVAHGAAEHIGRYQRFAEYFCARGYVVAGVDHPGHGKSEGTRVFVERFEDYPDVLRLFHRKLQDDYPQLPVFLLGHSLGGLIACTYLLEHQVDVAGCILSGPAIKTELEPGRLQTTLISLLSTLAPRLGVLQLDASGVSRDPAEVERYRADPLVYSGKMTARLVRELFGAMTEVQVRASEIRLPLLLLHGGADSMTAPAGSSLLHERVASQDKTLKIYPGLYHEIFNEPEYEAVFADVQSWLDERVGQAGA